MMMMMLKYHTITPRPSEHRRAFDRDNGNGRERSRSASPLQHHHHHSRKYAIGESTSSSRHSSGHRQQSPPSRHHVSSSPPPPSHPLPPPSHHYLPIAHPPSGPLPSQAIITTSGRRSRSRSPSSPSPLNESDVVGAPTSAPLPVGGSSSSLRSADGRSSSSRKAPSPVMTTVNTHYKIMNASYHPKLVRASASVGGGSPSVVDGNLGKSSSSSSANFISTQTLAMQLPNGTLISPGSLPPGIALAPLPQRGHAYVKLATGQQYIPISAPSSSPRSYSPPRSPTHHSAPEKESVFASSRRTIRIDNRDHSSSPGWDAQERGEVRLSERPPGTPPPTNIVPPGFGLSSNFILLVAQLPVSSPGSKPTTLVYPPVSSLSASEASSSQTISHIPDGAQYILNIPAPAASADVNAATAEATPGPHFIAFQVPVAAQQASKKTAKNSDVGRFYQQQ